MNELSGYVFSSLRGGRHRSPPWLRQRLGANPAGCRGMKRSRGCVERLEHEYALKSELDADWAARTRSPLTHDNGPYDAGA